MPTFSGAARFLVALLLVAWCPPAAGQQPQSGPPRPEAPDRAPAAVEAADDEDELPVSLDRIRARLAAQPRTIEKEKKDGVRLSYYVDVYGVAPPLDIFAPEINLTTSPVQYGGMTHREFLDLVTPQEFKSPAADIPSALAALIKWMSEKRKDSSDQR